MLGLDASFCFPKSWSENSLFGKSYLKGAALSRVMLKQRREMLTSNHKVRHPNVRHRRAKSQTSQREESDITARRVRHHSRRHPPPAVRQDHNSPPDTMSVSLPSCVTACLLFFPAWRLSARLLFCLLVCLQVFLFCSSARLLPACVLSCLPALSVFLFARLLPARAMACPRALLLARLSAGLPAYWDMSPGAASSGNWHSRRAKRAVEEEIESAPSYCRRRAKGVLF